MVLWILKFTVPRVESVPITPSSNSIQKWAWVQVVMDVDDFHSLQLTDTLTAASDNPLRRFMVKT
jgi:hypothetical protein